MADQQKLRVAIIGAGPAGLGAAIEFGKLPFVDFRIYDQATVLREVGTGISIQPNTWRMLDVMDASRNISPDEIFRPADHHSVQHRKYSESSTCTRVSFGSTKGTFVKYRSIAPPAILSVVRAFAFPEHKISYIGRTAYRGIVPTAEILSIPNFPDGVTFWHGPTDWVYTCNLNGGNYEITVNAKESADVARVSWGEKATLEEFQRPWKDFGPTVQAVINKVTDVQKFALFAGPRLSSVVARGAVALVGDASHPLSGAFGNGAGFALEDSYALAQSVAWAHRRGHTLKDGLTLYDCVRSPHYEEMYKILDAFAASDAILNEKDFSFDEAVAHTIRGKWGAEHFWLYEYDIQDVWKKAAEAEDGRRVALDTSHRESITVKFAS
ncbi:hypothetical protein UA08_00756 [Talaromyces atroroseus]|uniref:FAD-binding domain-containing protein n=1 Tax=Talaromyces atroroseus TaxID=1441469 RepID=A0A225BA31_TALAT|nr:hypothetical protein UA08_00756 [Talaromyces atroroseus]OKL63795.1 hypothetical protein UA08_00756 [Talaromyces atroroseus]